MDYSQEHSISTKHGNNALSYEARVKHFGEANISIPSLKKIRSVQELSVGKQTRIEEVDETLQMQTHNGLAYIYSLAGKTPTYIFDNHNHAFYFWMKHSPAHSKPISLIHIDQHSDLNEPSEIFELHKKNTPGYLRTYTNLACQISSFIRPFLENHPHTDFTRVKSEFQLLTALFANPKEKFLLLDIDIDFRASEMSIEKFEKTISITRQLIQEADLITIATSPMFIDQHLAIEITQRLLS